MQSFPDWATRLGSDLEAMATRLRAQLRTLERTEPRRKTRGLRVCSGQPPGDPCHPVGDRLAGAAGRRYGGSGARRLCQRHDRTAKEQAQRLRAAILARLYRPEEAAFYDLDASGEYVKIRCEILSRVCGEHVVDQATFESLWSRQLHDSRAFWAPLPLPSVALDDPLFVRPIPANSWGGAAQALRALRTGRWFDHYGESAAHAQPMHNWCEALMQDGTFRQQADALTARFTADGAPGYSPAALVMVDFTWRLARVCQTGSAAELACSSRAPGSKGCPVHASHRHAALRTNDL